MRIGMVCYPTYGGSGILATELGHELAKRGHCVHFITYAQPMRLDRFQDNIYYHEVETPSYPLMEFNQYTLALAGKILDVAKYEQLDVVHVHYAIPHAISAYLAKEISQTTRPLKLVTTLHGTDITLVDAKMASALSAAKLQVTSVDSFITLQSSGGGTLALGAPGVA
ncbi:MAG: glycosyltransferase, partial [Ignavibacteria bacterium]